MKKIENECVSCTAIGLYCLGSSCPNRNVVRYYCDCCKKEAETLYLLDDEELCSDCILERLEVVE